MEKILSNIMTNNVETCKNMNRMQVLLLTLVGRKFSYNFGGILQAYALQETIKKLGGSPKFIDYTPYVPKLNNKLINKIKIQKLPKLLVSAMNVPKYGIQKIEYPYLNRSKLIATTKFKQNYLKFTLESFSDFEKLKQHYKNSSEYTFIVGSDVVWSPRYNDVNRLKVFLLGFAHNGYKASYAASVGDPIPHHLRSIYKKYLTEFDFISVRERSSAKYLLDVLPTLDVEVVLDPTALLSREEWLKIAKPPQEMPQNPYILVYDIYRSNEIIPFVIKFAKRHHLGVLSYSYSLSHRIKGVETFYSYGPQEFIWLINDAKFVVTSSFHGTVFSTIFQKSFVSINPEPYAPVTRIRDYLDLIGARDRLLNDPAMIMSSDFENIDWKTINKKLNFHKKRSISYLKRVVRGG